MTAPSELDLRVCLDCGYDLRATMGDRCPECGTRFDRTLAVPRTPWLRAGWRVIRFWQTVFWVTVTPRRIADDVAHPAALAKALRFRRWLSIWLVIPPILVTAALYLDDTIVWSRVNSSSLLRVWTGSQLLSAKWNGHWTWYVEFACVGILFAATWLWIHLALGMPSYFAHPRRLSRDHQDRAIALTYYAAAPLAWMPLAVYLWLVVEWLAPSHAPLYRFRWVNGAAWPSQFRFTTQSIWLDGALLAIVLLSSGFALRATATLIRRTTQSGPGRELAAMATTLLAWPALLALFPVAIALGLILVELIVFSWWL